METRYFGSRFVKSNRINLFLTQILTHFTQRCRSETKNYLEYIFSSVLSEFKKYHRSGNLKFNNLGISKSLKLRISKNKIIVISLKLNFTPNTLSCYGLMLKFFGQLFPRTDKILLKFKPKRNAQSKRRFDKNSTT